jgi:hypothetical protein
MKKILVTRKLLKECEDKAQKTFDAKLILMMNFILKQN